MRIVTAILTEVLFHTELYSNEGACGSPCEKAALMRIVTAILTEAPFHTWGTDLYSIHFTHLKLMWERGFNEYSNDHSHGRPFHTWGVKLYIKNILINAMCLSDICVVCQMKGCEWMLDKMMHSKVLTIRGQQPVFYVVINDMGFQFYIYCKTWLTKSGWDSLSC